MSRIAIFPGSFDPITLGHLDILERAADLFDEIIVAIGINTTKQYMFPLEKRKEMIAEALKHKPHIQVETYQGLTVDYCRHRGAKFILRGLRSARDFDHESAIAGMNRGLNSGIETIFLISSPQYTHISSTIVREILKNKGDVSGFVPPGTAHIYENL
ncbi:MAG: pantetheine-phosphate adenylyltransferase [Bacteroidia bacterium]